MDDQYKDESQEVYAVCAAILGAMLLGAVAAIAAVSLAAWWFA